MTENLNNNETLTIAIAQCNIVWEEHSANLAKLSAMAQEAKGRGAELVIFPEAIITGFSMHIPSISVEMESPELHKVAQISSSLAIDILASFFVKEDGHDEGKPIYRNRVILFTQSGERFHQDKRHLFRPAGEAKCISPATERNIISYKGFNILMMACYDLRFPVWCRNRNNEYDILIDVANWPVPRKAVWSTLLRARAMENLAYVCGVNRVGVDAENLSYDGDSAIIDPKGNTLCSVESGKEGIAVATIEKAPMLKLRKKFPVWKDADAFELDPQAPYPIFD